MKEMARVGLRLPLEINEALRAAAHEDYMTKNQKAIEIFRKWMSERQDNMEVKR